MTITVTNYYDLTRTSINFADCIGVSEKQTDYANNCKSKVFAAFSALIFNKTQKELYLAINDKYADQVATLKANTDANFWINAKGQLMQSLIKDIVTGATK